MSEVVIFKDANVFVADFYFSDTGGKFQIRRLKILVILASASK